MAEMLRLAGAYLLFGYEMIATCVITIVCGTKMIQPVGPMIWIVVGLSAMPSEALCFWLAWQFITSTGLPQPRSL